MNPQELIQLREIFRKRFQEVDFCIGEEQVEILFRELLGENEPVPRSLSSNNSTLSRISASDIANVLREHTAEHIKDVFTRDDVFYRNLKSRES